MKRFLSVFSILLFAVANGQKAESAPNPFNAAVMHPNGKAYFFRDNQYYRFAFNPDSMEMSGVVNVDGWKGLAPNPGAAVSHPNGKTYFFNGDKYQRFDHSSDQIDKTGRIGIDGWMGVPTFIDSAVNHPNGKVYFFKDDKYYRFDFKTDKVDKVGVIGVDGWRGLPPKTTAAVLHPNGKAYFFINDLYYRFDFATDEVDKIGVMGVDGWKGLDATAGAKRVRDQYVSPLISAGSSQCLAIGSGSKDHGKGAIQWTCGSAGAAGNPEQLWILSQKPAGLEIVNLNSRLCLTIAGGKKDEAAPAVQLPCDGGLEQMWVLSADDRSVVNSRTKKCLALKGSSQARGTAVVQETCTHGDEQAWTVSRPAPVEEDEEGIEDENVARHELDVKVQDGGSTVYRSRSDINSPGEFLVDAGTFESQGDAPDDGGGDWDASAMGTRMEGVLTPEQVFPGLQNLEGESSVSGSDGIAANDGAFSAAIFGKPKWKKVRSHGHVKKKKWVLNANGTTQFRSGCGVFTCYGLFKKTVGDFTYIGKGKAKVIKGSVKWWLSGVNVTFNIPAEIGMSAAGSGLVWEPGQFDNEWREVISRPKQLQLNATILWKGYFTAQADFRVGSTWYQVQGN